MNRTARGAVPTAWGAPPEEDPDNIELQASSLAPLTAAILKARRGVSPKGAPHGNRPVSSHSNRQRLAGNRGYPLLSSQASAASNLWSPPGRSLGLKGGRSAHFGEGGFPTTALEESIARLNVLQNRLNGGGSFAEPALEVNERVSIRRGLLSPPARLAQVADVSSGSDGGREPKRSLRDELESAERVLRQAGVGSALEGEVKRVIQMEGPDHPQKVAATQKGGDARESSGGFPGLEQKLILESAQVAAPRQSLGRQGTAVEGNLEREPSRRHSFEGRSTELKREESDAAKFQQALGFAVFDAVLDGAEPQRGLPSASEKEGESSAGAMYGGLGQKVLWSTQVSRGDSMGEEGTGTRLATLEEDPERQRPSSYSEGFLSHTFASSTGSTTLESLQGRVSSLEAERGPLEGRLYEAIGRMSASLERAFQQRVERLEATMHDAVAEAVAFLGKKATSDIKTECERASADAQLEIQKKLGPAGMESLARRAVGIVGGKMGARATALETKAARALTVAKRTESQLRQMEAVHKLSEGHVSHLTAKVKKLKERVELAGQPTSSRAQPTCRCAGLCEGLEEGLEALKKDLDALKREIERREDQTERNERELRRKVDDLTSDQKANGRSRMHEAPSKTLESRIGKLGKEMGSVMRTEREYEQNGEALEALQRRIKEFELANPVKLVDDHKRETGVELDRVRADILKEVANASKTSDRNLQDVRTELSRVQRKVQEAVGDMSSSKEALSRELQKVRLTAIEASGKTTGLTDFVRKVEERTESDLGATRERVSELEGALEALQANLSAETSSFKEQLAGIQGLQKEGTDSDNFERLRESVEALQSVLDETTERLAELEEALEGQRSLTEGYEGLRAQMEGLGRQKVFVEGFEGLKSQVEEGLEGRKSLEEGLEVLKDLVAKIQAAAFEGAAEARRERTEGLEIQGSLAEGLEGLRQLVKKLEAEVSEGTANGKREREKDAKVRENLQKEMDILRTVVARVEGSASAAEREREETSDVQTMLQKDVEDLRQKLAQLKGALGDQERGVDSLRIDLDSVKALVARLEGSFSESAVKDREERLELKAELGSLKQMVSALELSVSETAAETSLERGEIAELHRSAHEGLEVLKQRVGQLESATVVPVETEKDAAAQKSLRSELDDLRLVVAELGRSFAQVSAKKRELQAGEEGSLLADVAGLKSHVAGLAESLAEARDTQKEDVGGLKERVEEIWTNFGRLEASLGELRAREEEDVGGLKENIQELRIGFERVEGEITGRKGEEKGDDSGSKESLEELRTRFRKLEEAVETLSGREGGKVGDGFASKESLDELRTEVGRVGLSVKDLQKLGGDLDTFQTQQKETVEGLRLELTGLADAVRETADKLVNISNAEESQTEGKGSAELESQVRELEKKVEEIRERQEKSDESLDGLREEVGRIVISVEDGTEKQRESEERAEALQRQMRRLAESVSEGDRSRKESVDGLRDEVVRSEGSVEDLAERMNNWGKEEEAAEKEKKMDVRMKLVESEADGLKQAVEKIEEESGGMREAVQRLEGKVGDLNARLSNGLGQCPLSSSIEELRELAFATERHAEEIGLKMEGLEGDLRRRTSECHMEGDLRRRPSECHVEQRVERLALAVGKLAETCARDHEALASRMSTGLGTGSRELPVSEESRELNAKGDQGKQTSFEQPGSTREHTERVSWKGLGPLMSTAGSLKREGNQENFDRDGTNSDGGSSHGESLERDSLAEEPGGSPRAESWDDIGAQLAELREDLTGGTGTEGQGVSISAWASAQSDAGMNPLFELGAHSGGRAIEKVPDSTSSSRFTEKDSTDASNDEGPGSREPLSLHENLLYLTPISPPSNQTSPLVVNSRDFQPALPLPTADSPAVTASSRPGNGSVLNGVLTPSGSPAGGSPAQRRPPSLRLDALPQNSHPNPPEPALRARSPLGRRSRSQASFSDKGWTAPATSAAEGRAQIARDSFSSLTSPVSPGTPRNLAGFLERRERSGADNPERVPSPVCPSPGLANEFLDPKELTPSPSPAKTDGNGAQKGKWSPADGSPLSNSSVRKEEARQKGDGKLPESSAEKGEAGPAKLGVLGDEEAGRDTDSCQSDDDMVTDVVIQHQSNGVGRASDEAGPDLESASSAPNGTIVHAHDRANQWAAGSNVADSPRSETDAPHLKTDSPRLKADSPHTNFDSPRAGADRYRQAGSGSGERDAEAYDSDSQDDGSDHEIDVDEEEIPEELDDWDLGVEGLEDVLGDA